jgi:hypothetical protein
MICEAIAGGGRDNAWCQDNCQILGGFPPVQRQSCPTAECRCSEYCVCNNGTVAEGRDCMGEKCPECDESLVFGRCPADGSAGGPLPITEGHAVLLIDGYPLEERGYTTSVPHNVTVFSGGSSRPMWFLVDVDQGHFETYAADSDKGISHKNTASPPLPPKLFDHVCLCKATLSSNAVEEEWPIVNLLSRGLSSGMDQVTATGKQRSTFMWRLPRQWAM